MKKLGVILGLGLALVLTACSGSEEAALAPSSPKEEVVQDFPTEPTALPDDTDSARTPVADADNYGIRFVCAPDKLKVLKLKMTKWFAENEISPEMVATKWNEADSTLEYRLHSKLDNTDTLTLSQQAQYAIPHSEIVTTKEILLSLMQRGRLFELRDRRCSFEVLTDHIEMRKNISRWAEKARWNFPEETPSRTNPEFWDSFRVVHPKLASDAIADAWSPGQQYLMGCTNSCIFIMAQGVLDFLKVIKKQPEVVATLDEYVGNNPLGNAEPQVRRDSVVQEGAYLTRYFEVPWNNWIAGDWGFIRNNDPESSEESGAEGSNIVYVGKGMFAVYYSVDSDRTLEQSIFRVYHWRDEKKYSPLPDEELFAQIRQDPYKSEGGMLRDVRDVPRHFTQLKKP